VLNNPQKTDLLIALTTAWLALAVLFAGAFVVAEHNHEHIDIQGHHLPTGENCRVCFEIQIALRLMEAFGRLGVSLVALSFIISAGPHVKRVLFFCIKNPVKLKVRFNC
jgi:hypothetical protein